MLAGLSDETLGEIAHMLPSVATAGDDGARLLQDERYRAHRAMRELLARLASPRPLVLVLDDVHWADPASVDLVAALVRGAPGPGVLIVLAARPRQVADRLRAALDRTDRHGGLNRLELTGLSRAAAGELLGDGVGKDTVERLYAETGGNPFYLEQLARADGTSGSGSPSPEGVPGAVLASLAEELTLLPAQTQRLLRGAAITGDPFEADVAIAASGIEEAVAMDAFDELLGVGLVRPTDVPRRFRFRHPLVRRAVYESTPGGWLLGAHARAAQSLTERGAPAAARAHHVEFAARPGDVAAVGVLAEAGMASLLRAPASAARWLSAALRILPADAPAEQRVGLLVTRARALAAQGRLAESHADLVEGIALAPPVALRVQLVTACAGVERLLGRHDEAHARLLTCLGQLPEQTAADAISLMLELAIDALFRSDFASMLEWADRAQVAARRAGRSPADRGDGGDHDARVRRVRPHPRGGGRLCRDLGAGRRDARRRAPRPQRRARVPVFGGHVPGSLRPGVRAWRARAAAGARRRSPAPDAGPGARGGTPPARAPGRGGERARRRPGSGAARGHHAEHGLDAAQPGAARGRHR